MFEVLLSSYLTCSDAIQIARNIDNHQKLENDVKTELLETVEMSVEPDERPCILTK